MQLWWLWCTGYIYVCMHECIFISFVSIFVRLLNETKNDTISNRITLMHHCSFSSLTSSSSLARSAVFSFDFEVSFSVPFLGDYICSKALIAAVGGTRLDLRAFKTFLMPSLILRLVSSDSFSSSLFFLGSIFRPASAALLRAF